jgi:hypothetical protein
MNRRWITRIKEYNTWQVRIPHLPTKCFADTNYGGEEQSLKAALSYRDRLLKTLNISIYRKGRFQHLGKLAVDINDDIRCDNVVGVREVIQVRDGRVEQTFRAFWREEGKTRSRSFSIRRYGAERAFQMAVTERKRHT